MISIEGNRENETEQGRSRVNLTGRTRLIKRKRLWGTLLVSLCAVSISLIATREPTYEGIRLSSWVSHLPLTMVTLQGIGEAQNFSLYGNDFGVSDREQTERAIHALQTLGTNAIPSLLKAVGRSDSSLKLKLLQQIVKSGYSPPRFLLPASATRGQAVTALRLMGTNLVYAIPELTVLSQSKDAEVRATARVLIRASTNAPLVTL